MRQWTIYIILLLSIFIANCSQQKELTIEPSVINWDDLLLKPKTDDDLCKVMQSKEIDDWENIKRDFTTGLAVGFLPEHLSMPRQIAHETYWVNSNVQLSFNWLFWYPEGNETPATLRLFVLMDEHQLDNALPEPGFYNDIDLERGNDMSIKVRIPPLEPGVHDVIVIGIPYPENNPDVYGSIVVISRRVTLIAEPASAPFRKVNFTPLHPEGSIKKDDPLLTLELTLKKEAIDIWNWPDPWLHAQTNTSTPFYALTGYQDVTNLDAPPMDPLDKSFFAMLLFADYQQIEIAPNQMAFYGKVNNDTAFARIPLEIPPLPEGKHHILVLRIDTPGVPMCLLAGDSKGRIIPNSIYGKLVGIEVLPPK